MCVWLMTAVIPFQSHYCFVSKVHEAWDENQRRISSPTLPFAITPIPMLEQN